jgi:hypothetical protein
MRKIKCMSAYDRVMRRTKIPLDKSECWLWTGPVNNAGYGMIRGNDGVPKMTTVHRVVGIHKGLNWRKEIQHTCLTKNCVNPDHLVNGDPQSRHDRMVDKHGNYFHKPKIPYKTCEHCGKQSHVIWFSRLHGDCYTYKPACKV